MADDIPQAAKERAHELAMENKDNAFWTNGQIYAFARFIAQVSDAAKEAMPFGDDTPGAVLQRCQRKLSPFILDDPVDPLLLEAREIVKASLDPDRHKRCECRTEIDNGEWDRGKVNIALTGLKRGMELASERQANWMRRNAAPSAEQ